MVTAASAAAASDDVSLLEESHTDPERFALLFDRYHTEIYRFVASRLDTTIADDIAAETFLVAFDKRTRFDADGITGHVRAWLYGIATNLIRRHRRSEERKYRALARTPVDRLTDGHDDRIAAEVSAGGARPALAAALASLTAGDRDVLLLVAIAELNHHEVAAALGIPYGTVCSRLNRARRKTRETLSKHGLVRSEQTSR